ncbi:hypothetical protein [Streptomyces sp. UNOC14_S4]|uniref:terpene synthase family protein n=1 Tax=Streptomyces sp. UNOC14_S4 TaxID=2872340 RepID=UPI001E2A95AF|nr:hypothetical protein [Streptomyces sp. UNOC14_S4]MCC3770667.1 hypothetical protein [Streptomyces sp. UNOC14_S4]
MPSTPPPVPGSRVRVSPYAPETAAFLDRWVRRTGLTQSFSAQRRFRRAGCAAFAARVMPDAECARLQRGAAWLVWFFVLDGILDGTDGEHGPGGQPPPFADALLDFLPMDTGRTPPPRTALERALADAWRMVAPVMSPEWRLRFRTRFGEFTCAWLPGTAGGGRAPGAAHPLLELIEYTSGHEVPDAVRELPEFRAVAEAAVLPRPGERKLSPDFLAARAAALRRADSELARELLRQGLPDGALAYTGALSTWLAGLSPDLDPEREREVPADAHRLGLADDVTAVGLLRPRRPVPPPAPSTGGGTGALQGGSE